MRLELSQPQPPTATTGTTYIIEMYQCIRQAKGAIPAKSSTPSPRLLSGAGRALRRGAVSARDRRTRATAAHEQHEREARERDREAEDDHGEWRLGAFGRPEQLPVDGAPAGADRDRHLPVEDQRARALVLDAGGRGRRHPVDAVVVPFELAGA